ncbi:MAG: thioredoxin family protein [Chloroflexota bacterium]
MTKIIDIEAHQFESDVLQNDSPIIVDFYGAGCAVCVAVAQWLETFDQDSMLPVRKIFLSDPISPLAQRYQLRGIPTLIRFEGGQETARLTGQFSINSVRDFVCVSSEN